MGKRYPAICLQTSEYPVCQDLAERRWEQGGKTLAHIHSFGMVTQSSERRHFFRTMYDYLFEQELCQNRQFVQN
jgi:hypothetical protein